MADMTERFSHAVEYARKAHAGQVRKGTNIPYFTHLLGVATLVIEQGGTEDQAIAGLLHDLLEDCGQDHEGFVRAQFGDRVGDIVLACTDGTAEGKARHEDPEAKRRDWLVRKVAYLEHLETEPDDVLLVSGCDKLHNARAILADLEDRRVGLSVFSRFTGGKVGTLGYYQSLVNVFSRRGTAIAGQLDNVVGRMHQLAGNAAREPLYVERSDPMDR